MVNRSANPAMVLMSIVRFMRLPPRDLAARDDGEHRPDPERLVEEEHERVRDDAGEAVTDADAAQAQADEEHREAAEEREPAEERDAAEAQDVEIELEDVVEDVEVRVTVV